MAYAKLIPFDRPLAGAAIPGTAGHFCSEVELAARDEKSYHRGIDDARAGFAAVLAAELAGAGDVGAIAWLPIATELGLAPPANTATREQLVAFAWLAIVAAPLVEEPLFRGILLRALGRSSTPLVAAVWSSALFAILHPVGGWLPVFALGLAAAMLRQRTNWLPACIVAHAAYNAVVSLHALA